MISGILEQDFAKDDATVLGGLDKTDKGKERKKKKERQSIFTNELSITKSIKVKMFLFIDNSALYFLCSKSLKCSFRIYFINYLIYGFSMLIFEIK